MTLQPLSVVSICLGTVFCPISPCECADDTRGVKNTQTSSFAVYEKGAHTGSAESALVAIRVTGTSPNGTPIAPRYGNGLILRCDGFIVAPFDLFNLTPDSTPSAPSKLSALITINPGTDHEQHIAMPRRSRYFIDNKRRIGFTVFKLDGQVHIPAARTMLPDTLKAGDSVQIVWREVDPSGKPGGLVHKAAHLAALPEGLTGEGVVEDTSDHPGRVHLAEYIDAVPAGAEVIGPEGLVVGIMPGAGVSARDSFVSLAALNQVTNSVGPLPASDEQFRSMNPTADSNGRTDTASKGKMVKVPGGPLIVPKDILADQPDMEGGTIACVAPFEIDRREVTNDEYFAFWNTLTEKQKSDPMVRKQILPLSWSPVGDPYSLGIGQLPVLGVPVSGAEAYARSMGKRLPTPYEWAKAAFGPNGDRETPEWMANYLADRRKAWDKLIVAHREYIRTSVGLLEFARHPIDKDGKPLPAWEQALLTVPWVQLPEGYSREVRYSFETTRQLVDQMNSLWQSPTSVIGVGTRKYDVSMYGAEDMFLNALELYLPNPSAPVNGAARYMFIDWDMAHPEIVTRQSGFTPYQNDVEFPWGFVGNFAFPWDRVKLSRLYKRTVVARQQNTPPAPIDLRCVVFMSNLNEMTYALRPVTRWYASVGRHYEVATTPSGASVDLLYLLTHPEFPPSSAQSYAIWSSSVINYSPELGYPPATSGTLLASPDRDYYKKGGQKYDLHYILPVGFRCAR